MGSKNIILEILESNDLSELFMEEEDTLLEMENLISCPKNEEDPKEQNIPISQVVHWIHYLRNLEDVIEITKETAGYSTARGLGKEMRVSLILKLRGAMKYPKKGQDFGKVFRPIHETLLELLSQKLSYPHFVNQAPPPLWEGSEEERSDLSEENDIATELARSAIE
ncbi:hypothetical protein WDW89_18880 [Deltaproteobacteria bacterium TL4]